MNSNLAKLKALIFYGSFLASVYLGLTHQTRPSGSLALYVLTLVLFSKPLAQLFPTVGLFKILLAVRRQTGQASAFFAFSHLASQLFPGVSLLGFLTLAATSGPQNFQFWGFWALALMAILFVTSNDISTRLLKRNWFLLHQLIHPLYIFAMLHVGLRKDYFGLIPYILVLFTLYLARFLAGRGVRFFASVPSPGS